MLSELVVCSLEPWDEVWRRNQFFVDALLRRLPALQVLFVEPPADTLFEVRHLRRPVRPRLTPLRGDRRLQAFRPLKPLPRRCGPFTDRWLCQRVIAAAQRLGFASPTLWLNDVTYAPLIHQTSWPTLYDVTDDWLLAPFPPREISRLRRLDAIALADAQEVVVCSSALAATRGACREVTLVPNGVDIEHFRLPRPRPTDLPAGRTAVYVGTLHESRLDVALVIEIARALTGLSVVLVGPDSLPLTDRRALCAEPNILILGARPYADVPAYLSYADVVVVPHLVTPFTESLDPIKAYESLAVQTPVVATPVAGFRELGAYVTLASRESFVAAVAASLAAVSSPLTSHPLPSWTERARTFEFLLTRAGDDASGGPST